MIHLDEKTLELYVLGAREVAEQHTEIERHLKECAGCSALLKEISEYYSEVEALQPEEVEASTKALTVRDWIVHARAFGDRTPARPVERSLPLRAVIFAVRHPGVTSMSFLALLAAALLLSYPRKGPTDLNPAYARAKDEFLVVYNKEGEVLWRKHVGMGYDFEKHYVPNLFGTTLDNILTVIDVDGDGKNEVIAIDKVGDELPNHNAIICYNSDGKERWRYEVYRKMTFGKQPYSDDYRMILMMVGDFVHKGIPEVIAVAHHVPDFPCLVSRLDARDGELLGEYWHPGYIDILKHADVDSDGVEELILGGVNNAYGLAALAILDPSKVVGHGPGTANYIPRDIQPGAEKYYILFPHTDLHSLALDKKNWVSEISPRGNGLLQVGVGEMVEPGKYYGVSYYLDSSMNVRRLLIGVDFESLHHRLEAEGKLTRELDEQYYKELRDGVQYWDGDRFVKEPTMNRRYREVAQK